MASRSMSNDRCAGQPTGPPWSRRCCRPRCAGPDLVGERPHRERAGSAPLDEVLGGREERFSGGVVMLLGPAHGLTEYRDNVTLRRNETTLRKDPHDNRICDDALRRTRRGLRRWDRRRRDPLVFLPGLTFDRTMWRPARRSLRTIDPGRTTLALDMPGEGESIGTFRGLEIALEQLHVAIASAGAEIPVLVGHSGSAIAAMFYAMKYPVRGIVNVDAVLDNDAFSARLRALAPQLRNGGIPALWDELFAGMHAERSGPAGAAMLRGYVAAASRCHARLLGARARTPSHRCQRHRRRDREPACEQTPYTLVLGEEPDAGTRAWMAHGFPRRR